MVKEKPTSWKDFVELTKGPYSGKVTVLDGIPECIGSMLVMLGYSFNSEDEGEIDEAKQQLIDLKPHLLAITSTEYKQHADRRQGRDGARLERRRRGRGREEAGRVRGGRGGRRVLGRRVRDPDGREEPDGGARMDRLLLRPEEQRARDRVHLLRLAGQAGPDGAGDRQEGVHERRRLPAGEHAREDGAERRSAPRARSCATASGPSSRPRSSTEWPSRHRDRAHAGAPATRAGAGGPRYPGWLALPALAWYVAFFVCPLAIMAVFSFSRREGFTDIVYDFNLENYEDLVDPLYGKVFTRTLGLAAVGHARHARHRLPARVLPGALGQAQDASAPARGGAVLDEHPDPHLRVADHLRPGLPADRRLGLLYTTRRSTSGWSTPICR